MGTTHSKLQAQTVKAPPDEQSMVTNAPVTADAKKSIPEPLEVSNGVVKIKDVGVEGEGIPMMPAAGADLAKGIEKDIAAFKDKLKAGKASGAIEYAIGGAETDADALVYAQDVATLGTIITATLIISGLILVYILYHVRSRKQHRPTARANYSRAEQHA